MGEEVGWAKSAGAARNRARDRARVFMANMIVRRREESMAGGVCPDMCVIVPGGTWKNGAKLRDVHGKR